MTATSGTGRRPRVVVVGAGFGGLAVARGLAKAPVDLMLIDRTNHNLFQPLLYQVATAALAPSDIAVPVRALFGGEHQVEVRMGEIVGIDTVARTVLVTDMEPIAYDFLVIATGSVYSWFGHDQWAQHSHALKTLEQALTLRSSLLAAFELAESRSDTPDLARLLTFVIVGGGPTGVELAGALAELAHSTLARDFNRISLRTTRIVLCEAGKTLLPGFPANLTTYAQRQLEQLGVEVLTGVSVEQVDHEGVVAGGKRIASANVMWCAGTAATPAAGWLGVEKGKNGLVPVSPDCSVPDRPGVFAIGDVATMAPLAPALPAVAPVAKQQGAHVARVIAAAVTGTAHPGPFRYKDEGKLAIIGRSAAVADLGRFKLTGLVAWLLWSAVHLFFLIGARNRLAVYLNWAFAWVTYGRGARLITFINQRTRAELAPGTSPSAEQAPASTGPYRP